MRKFGEWLRSFNAVEPKSGFFRPHCPLCKKPLMEPNDKCDYQINHNPRLRFAHKGQEARKMDVRHE